MNYPPQLTTNEWYLTCPRSSGWTGRHLGRRALPDHVPGCDRACVPRYIVGAHHRDTSSNRGWMS